MADTNQTSLWGSVEDFGIGLFNSASDFVSGAVDPVLTWGLSDWLDYNYTPVTGPGGQQYSGTNPPVDATGHDPNTLANANSGPSNETLLLLAGGVVVVGLLIYVVD